MHPLSTICKTFKNWPATALAAFVLRCSNWPGRQLAGLTHRRASRRCGGVGFTAHSKDGTKLAGWYVPGEHLNAAVKKNAAALPAIVMMHGWLEIKELHFKRARRLAKRGHDVVLFDHRGHGASRHAAVTFGLRESEDLAAVIEEACRRQFIREKIVVIGYSMGAATALSYAQSDNRIFGVVAIAPFANLINAILGFRNCLAPWISSRWLLGGFERGAQNCNFTLDQVSITQAAKKLDKPVLVVSAEKDYLLPYENHVKLILESKTHGRLEHFVVPDARHVNICRKDFPKLDSGIDAFLDSATAT